MDILFPPVLESQGLAFPYVTENAVSQYYEIRFALPLGTDPNGIGHVQVSIKDLNTGAPAVAGSKSPDKEVLYISADSIYFIAGDDGNYTLKIPYDCWINGAPAQNTTYCIQVRFGSSGLWTGAGSGLEGTNFPNFASWRIAETTRVPSGFGEWSNIMKAYCYKVAAFGISFDSYADFMPGISYYYRGNDDDPIQQIKATYWFSTVHGIEMREEVFSGEMRIDKPIRLPIAPIKTIQVGIEAVTKNNAKYYQSGYIQPIQNAAGYITEPDGMGKLKDVEMSAPEQEDGTIAKMFKAPPDLRYFIGNDDQGRPQYNECKTFNVYRIETLTTKCIKIISQQPITKNEEVSFKDYTCEMGEEYQYVVIATTDAGVCKYFLSPLLPYGDTNPGYARLMRMDSTYLVTRAHQLRLQGNVQVSNFKRNTQDNFQTTIGSKYPFYSRASKINYRTFSLNGVISINFDPTSSFLRLDAIGKIELGRTLTFDQYSVLIAKSPGLEQFFQQVFDQNGNPVYIFQGSQDPDWMSVEESVSLVNRCASTLALNGLWWDDDNGEYSQLYILDKDIIEHEELSLSRERRYGRGYQNGVDLRDASGTLGIYDLYLHRQTGLNYTTDKSDSMIYIERKFREKVMEWLSDGKPKLFRSETEGNMIVMLSGASFTPLDKTGRMVYSVSMTVTEIADMTSENLEKYNLVPSLIKSVYVDSQPYKYVWGGYDQAVNKRLTYEYYDIFKIPNMEIGNSEGELSIHTMVGVFHASGSDNLIFSASHLPNGIEVEPENVYENGVLVKEGGTIKGYPRNISELMTPGFAVLTVEDTVSHLTSSITVPYGYMYLPLRRTQENVKILISGKRGKATINVGEEINPIDLSQYHTGGVGPYTYAPTNKRLPDGVTVNNSTGEITGVYSTATDGSDAEILVRDSLGNTVILPVSYKPGQIPLTFIKQSKWDFGYLEVGVEIPDDKIVKPGVAGGNAGKDGENYRFSLEDEPEGIVIDNKTGQLRGKPTEALPPGSFTVKVTDGIEEKSIQINYNTILDAFKFEGRPLEGYPIQKIWIPTSEATASKPDDIILGTILVGVDVNPYVSGGLPFTSGAPYRFTAVGLLPDWEITTDGILKGKARTSMAAHEATLIVKDSRGEQRTCIIKVGLVKGGIEFSWGAISIDNLYVGSQIKDSDVSYASTTNKTLTIPQLNVIHGGTAPYGVVLKEAPPGIILKAVEVNDNPGWKFEGSPTQSGTARIGWLEITDKNAYSLRVPVNFGPVTKRLDWVEEDEDKDPNTTIKGAPGAVVYANIAATGGLADFTVDYTDVSPELSGRIEIEKGNREDISTFRIKVTLPTIGKFEGSFNLKITDGNDVKINRVYKVYTNATKIKLTFLKDFRTDTVMADHAVFDEVPVIEISGGTGGYTFCDKDSTFGNISIGNGNMQFAIKDNKIVVKGTPKFIWSNRENMAASLMVTDSEISEKVPFDQQILSPLVVLAPEIGNNIEKNDSKTVGTLRKDGLLYLTVYTSPDIFNNLQFPGVRVDQSGSLPQGIFRDAVGDKSFRISGKATAKTPEDTTMVYTLVTPKTDYDEAITLEVTVIFGAIQGSFKYSIPSMTMVPALTINQEMTPFVISDNLEGGVGPFEWKLANEPTGLKVEYSGDGRVAKIVGTPTVETGAGVITILVTDTANGIEKTASLSYQGIYKGMSLKKAKVEIPPMQGGQELSAINLDEYIDGGVTPYKYTEDERILSIRGYHIFANSIGGEASQYGFAEEEGTITVTDSKGLQIDLPFKVGKITGDLYYNPAASGIKASIPAGEKGATLSNPGNYLNLLPGVSGGKETYTFKESVNNGWSKYGFEITIDNLTGKATKIKYPAQAENAGSFEVDITDGEATVVATVNFGKVNGPIRWDASASGVVDSIAKGNLGTTIPAAKLPKIVNGIKGGKTPYKYKASTSNGWEKYGFTLTLNENTGAFSNGKYPSSKSTGSSFDVIVTDADNKTVTVPIYFDL